MAFTPAEAHMSQPLQSPSSPADVPSSKASPLLRPQTHLDMTSVSWDSASCPSLWGPVPHCFMPSLLSLSQSTAAGTSRCCGDGGRRKKQVQWPRDLECETGHSSTAPVVTDGTPDKSCHSSSRCVMGGASQGRRQPKKCLAEGGRGSALSTPGKNQEPGT